MKITLLWTERKNPEKVAGYVAPQASTGDQFTNQMVEVTKKEGSISCNVFFAHRTKEGKMLNENQGLYSELRSYGNENSSIVGEFEATVKSGEISLLKVR